MRVDLRKITSASVKYASGKIFIKRIMSRQNLCRQMLNRKEKSKLSFKTFWAKKILKLYLPSGKHKNNSKDIVLHNEWSTILNKH